MVTVFMLEKDAGRRGGGAGGGYTGVIGRAPAIEEPCLSAPWDLHCTCPTMLSPLTRCHITLHSMGCCSFECHICCVGFQTFIHQQKILVDLVLDLSGGLLALSCQRCVNHVVVGHAVCA